MSLPWDGVIPHKVAMTLQESSKNKHVEDMESFEKMKKGDHVFELERQC